MKPFTLILFLLISTFSFSQKFISKVVAMNGQNVKYENSINITDSIITVKSNDYDLSYIVENQVQYYYQTDQYGNKFNFTIAPLEGKSLGFKYTHAITMISINHPNELPAMVYYAIKTNEK